MLERHIEVGKNQSFSHQRHDVINVRVRVDIVQTRPKIESAQFAAKIN